MNHFQPVSPWNKRREQISPSYGWRPQPQSDFNTLSDTPHSLAATREKYDTTYGLTTGILRDMKQSYSELFERELWLADNASDYSLSDEVYEVPDEEPFEPVENYYDMEPVSNWHRLLSFVQYMNVFSAPVSHNVDDTPFYQDTLPNTPNVAEIYEKYNAPWRWLQGALFAQKVRHSERYIDRCDDMIMLIQEFEVAMHRLKESQLSCQMRRDIYRILQEWDAFRKYIVGFAVYR
jgi:hypothetical protein